MEGSNLQIVTQIIIPLAVAFTAGDGLVRYLLERKLKKKDITPRLIKKLNQNGEGTEVCLRAMKVVLKALREGHINGESEMMEEEIDTYFATCTSNGFYIEEDVKQ